MEYRKEEFGGGSSEKDLLVKYESYLSDKIYTKLKGLNMEEKLGKYLTEISTAKTIEQMYGLADKWEIAKLQE